MANYTVTGTLVANTVQAVTLAQRWGYVTVENTGATEVSYARTDGTAAVIAADFNFPILPGQSALLANMAPLWTQAASVIGAGSNDATGRTIYGGTANPGTTVSLISSLTPTFTVMAAG